MPHSDPDARAAYQRSYYLQRRKARIEGQVVQNRRSRARVRDAIHEAKSQPCLDCGLAWPYYVMQFDHVRGEKEFNIAEATRRGIGLERVLAEIVKCEVVCANCHAIRTHDRL